MRKIMLPIQGDFVAPRFDLAAEVLIVNFEHGKIIGKPKSIIMERPSDEGLCQMAVEEHITDMVCGGIEELHFNFLVWKKIEVIDGIIGDWKTALSRALEGKLHQREIILDQGQEVLSL